MPEELPEGATTPALLLRALRWHDDWHHLKDTLEEQFRHLHRAGPPRKSTADGVMVMSRIVHEVGNQPYNEGLAMAASALNMSVKLLVMAWEFRCKWMSRRVDVANVPTPSLPSHTTEPTASTQMEARTAQANERRRMKSHGSSGNEAQGQTTAAKADCQEDGLRGLE